MLDLSTVGLCFPVYVAGLPFLFFAVIGHFWIELPPSGFSGLSAVRGNNALIDVGQIASGGSETCRKNSPAGMKMPAGELQLKQTVVIRP